MIISLGFFSCQNSTEEITPINDIKSFTTNSELAINLSKMTLLDGSADNYLDNASCLTLSFPFTAIVNQEEVVIDSEEDLLSYKVIFDQNPYANNFELVYPVQAKTSDYSELTIVSRDALTQLATQCIENGEDDDIECIDFSYPLSISTYNSASLQQGVKNLQSDQELFQFIRRSDENEIMGFNFPIQLIDVDGSTVTINDNNELNAEIIGSSIDCEENDDRYFGTSVELQRVNLQLTDAPFPFDLVKEANVTIGQIDLITGDDNDSIPFITLSTEEQSFNLLNFTNGLTTDLAEADIPVGLYDHIRLEVTESTVELNDGTIYDLNVPSGRIRLIGEELIEVKENQSLELLADFDVSRSFVVQGNPNTPAGIRGFLFKPVVKLSDLSKTGTLTGAVTQSGNGVVLEGVQISVYAADTLNTTSFTNSEGMYTVLGLMPGEYDVTAEFEGFTSVTVEAIEIERDTDTVQNFELNEE